MVQRAGLMPKLAFGILAGGGFLTLGYEAGRIDNGKMQVQIDAQQKQINDLMNNNHSLLSDLDRNHRTVLELRRDFNNQIQEVKSANDSEVIKKIEQEAKKMVVDLEFNYTNESKYHESWTASGIIIDINEDRVLVLTNAHAISGNGLALERNFGKVKIKAFTHRGDDINAKIFKFTDKDGNEKFAYDEKCDLALIEIRGKLNDVLVAQLAESVPEDLRLVVAVGNSLGFKHSRTVHRISSTHDENYDYSKRITPDSERNIPSIQISPSTNIGNSGGGGFILDDNEKVKLLVVTTVIRGDDGISGGGIGYGPSFLRIREQLTTWIPGYDGSEPHIVVAKDASAP